MMFLFDWKSSTEKLTMFYLNISFAKNDGTAGEKVVFAFSTVNILRSLRC